MHRHFDDQIHRDLELACGLREHQACLVVSKRVLLPVDEMIGGLDTLAVRQDLGAAVRRWTQPDDLWAEFDQAVVLIMRDVVQGNVDGHAVGFLRGEGVDPVENKVFCRLKQIVRHVLGHDLARP